MAKPQKRQQSSGSAGAAEVLKDILIAQLGIAGVPQQSIRRIVGCDMHRVSRIVRHLKNAKHKE
jgi:hypothetical protein